MLLKFNRELNFFSVCSSLDSIGSRSSEDSMIACLSEAQRTVFVRDRWIQLSDHESTGGIRYSVVAPTLPGSGDYSAYHDWGKFKI